VKCFDLMAPMLGRTRARELIDTVWNIEQVIDMRSLRSLLQATLSCHTRAGWLHVKPVQL
jgi:hypothetical protein